MCWECLTLWPAKVEQKVLGVVRLAGRATTRKAPVLPQARQRRLNSHMLQKSKFCGKTNVSSKGGHLEAGTSFFWDTTETISILVKLFSTDSSKWDNITEIYLQLSVTHDSFGHKNWMERQMKADCLPSTCEALGPNPRTAPRKKTKANAYYKNSIDQRISKSYQWNAQN